ncbi:MAG: hypothetical protein R2765_10835 [Ferruginibacter sp.]
MAMHTSNELKEVAKEMRNQLHLLGQKELETFVPSIYGTNQQASLKHGQPFVHRIIQAKSLNQNQNLKLKALKYWRRIFNITVMAKKIMY